MAKIIIVKIRVRSPTRIMYNEIRELNITWGAEIIGASEDHSIVYRNSSGTIGLYDFSDPITIM